MQRRQRLMLATPLSHEQNNSATRFGCPPFPMKLGKVGEIETEETDQTPDVGRKKVRECERKERSETS